MYNNIGYLRFVSKRYLWDIGIISGGSNNKVISVRVESSNEDMKKNNEET